jgi:Spy/CpxP family protein refolding chaperone
MLVTRVATTMVLGGLVALSGTAWAQDGGEKEETKLTSSRKTELDRMKSRLDLSDAQFEKVVKIFEKADGELKELLTANQKDTFKERYDRQSNRGGAAGAMGGMMGGMAKRMMDSMTGELDLNEEQKAKVQKVVDESMEKVNKTMADARENGNWGAMREVMTTMREESTKKIRELLSDEQKTKFDEMQQNMGGMMGRNRGGRSRGGESERGSRGSSSVDWRMRNILRDLNLSEDEKLILEPTIKAVLEAQGEARKAIDEARKALRESASNTTDEVAIKAAIAKVRESEKGAEANVDGKRAELRELVTLAQEAILVGHGVLK